MGSLHIIGLKVMETKQNIDDNFQNHLNRMLIDNKQSSWEVPKYQWKEILKRILTSFGRFVFKVL